MALTPKEQERLNYLCDLAHQSKAIWWAEKEFGWRPLTALDKKGKKREAWYQYLLLASCDDIFNYPEDYEDKELAGKPIKKFAWRIGRQCLVVDSLVHTRDGNIIPIQESPDAWKIGIRPIVEISVDNGSKLKCTPEHKFFTIDGPTEVKNLKKGDKIRSLVSWDKFGYGEIPYAYTQYVNKRHTDKISGSFIINDEIAEFIGWITADGCISNKKKGVKFTNTNLNYCKRVEYLVNKYFPDITITWHTKSNIKQSGNEYVYKKTTKFTYDLLFTTKENYGRKNSIKDLIRIMDYDVCGFPKNINHFTESQLCYFFKGMYAIDGSILEEDNETASVNLCCGLEKKYAEYCREYLNKLGISCSIHEQLGKLSTPVRYKVYFNSNENNFIFQNTIGEILEKPNIKINKHTLNCSEHFEDIDGELYQYSNITSIEPCGEEEVWNIEYPCKGRYFSGGLLHKNSGKTEIISLTSLYLAVQKPIKYFKPKWGKESSLVGTIKDDGTIHNGWVEKEFPFLRGAKIICASADADKARTVFDRVMKFVSESPKFSVALAAGTIEMKISPYPELKIFIPGWSEPASISFRGPGANGQALRSKTYDYKLYDEADYIPEAFWQAEKATGINAGDSGLTIISSTPTGKRGYFYNACFIKDTPVTMSNKKFKNIQLVEIGDSVINRWGKAETVTDTMVNNYTGPIVSIKTTESDTDILTSTANHRFMAVKKQSRLCKGCDSLQFSLRSYCPLYGNHSHLKETKPEYIALKDLDIGDFIAIPRAVVQISHTRPGGFAKDTFYYVPITDYVVNHIENIKVYNLTVGKDHSYCVNNFAVANCVDKKLNFQEFHIPSRENPRYTKQFDKEFRAELPMTTYQHEIEADWGTVEEGVFDWTFFEWVFRHTDSKPNSKNPTEEINIPIYNIFDTKNGTKKKPFPNEYEYITVDAKFIQRIGSGNLGRWMQTRFPARENGYVYWFGADSGYSSDPSEFVVFKERNGIMKMVLRVHMEHIEYPLQCDIIALMDNFYEFQALGLDEGSNGMSMRQLLQGKDPNGFNKYRKHNFDIKLHPVNFKESADIMDGFTKDNKKVSAKQFMTDAIIMAAQNRQIQMPSDKIDEPLLNQFRNHTYTVTDSGTIKYSKGSVYPDHCVDAIRTVFWAKAQFRKPRNKKWPTGTAFRPGSRGGAWS